VNRQGHKDTKFFVGEEIEHTPAHGLRTLFVVGLQNYSDIVKAIDDAKASGAVHHIYFGANHSFPNGFADSKDWDQWEDMIRPFLEQGFWCTLDIDVAVAEDLLETALTEYIMFIPMISVKLPYVQQLGYNATIKLDDKDFAATNPGVWCHRLHTLTRPSVFTHWNQYSKDQTL
jgi:hypothetical protein